MQSEFASIAMLEMQGAIDNGYGETALNCSPQPPLLGDVGVLALPPTKWADSWQAWHQNLTRLSRYFHVVWCNPGVWWRDEWRRPAPQDSVNHDSSLAPGLAIYQPERWLPELGRPAFLSRWSREERWHRAHRILRDKGCRKIILYLWRPNYEPVLDVIDHDLSCYHIDDEYTFSEIEKPIDEGEARLISRVGQVFIHSPALLEKKGRLNPHTICVPNGVDFRAYTAQQSEPVDLKAIPHPRIGYVGRIKPQLDLALLIDLARRHRQWSFVLVGPQEDLGEGNALRERLGNMPNVYFLGGRPVAALPGYTQHLDVCMLCYRMNGYTKFIYPLKLHEYLASGRPVVGSPIRSLQDFDHLIRLAQTTDDWSRAIQDSLSPAACSAEQVEARRAVARQHDWNRLIQRIAQTMCSRLGPDYEERLRKSVSCISK